MPATRAEHGAYGLILDGVGDADGLLVPPGPAWVRWTIERRSGAATGDGSIDSDRASIALHPSGELAVDRAAARSVLTTPWPLPDGALAHPYLGPIAAIAARWLGRQSFHAGAVAVDGGAWGVLGGQAAGKSSLLADLARRGVGVLCDDLLVVDGRTAFAGPRCLDLREDAAAALGAGEPIGVVGMRERWRVRLAPVPAELPLRGWLVVEWGERVAVRSEPPAARMRRLAENLSVAVAPPDPVGLLDLAALPMHVLTRPRDFAALDAGAGALLAALRAR